MKGRDDRAPTDGNYGFDPNRRGGVFPPLNYWTNMIVNDLTISSEQPQSLSAKKSAPIFNYHQVNRL